MRKLVRRARHVCRNEGVASTIRKSARFIPRYLRHVFGTNGFYGNQYYQKLLFWWNTHTFSVVADPFKIVHIDPNEITHVTGRGPNPGQFQWQDLGRIQGGDWDQCNERVEDLPVVRALQERFENDTDWEEIEFIQYVLKQTERGNIIWRGCESADDVWDACERIDQLYKDIKEEGYRSKQDLVQQRGLSPHKYSNRDQFNRYDEVVVDIGRDGQFLFVDGRHRLAIAKILDLGEIPVRISARHEQWQRRRETTADVDDIEALSETTTTTLRHPDLLDLLNDN